jgi:hypothetical protein
MELERLAVDTDLRINSTLASISQTQQDRTSVDLQLQRIGEETRVRTAESLAETETEMAVQGRRMAAGAEFLALIEGDSPAHRNSGQASVDRAFIMARAGRDETEIVKGVAPVRPGDILTVARQIVTAPVAVTSQTPPVSAALTGVPRQE